MTDLTKITEPFGLLDKATQGALVIAFHEGAKIEWYTVADWRDSTDPTWFSTYTYRVKPEPVRVKLNYSYTSEHLYTRLAAIIIGRHVITCNPNGTDPAVTWEPSE